MGILKTGIVCAGALLAAGAAETAYFYGRTMKRQNVNMDRTIKMAGTDWSQYSAILAERKAFMLSQPHEDVYQTSFDGLKLHASYFPAIQDTDKKRIVICFHGYTSRSLADFTGLTDYYFRHGFAMLHPDARAHGDSEGEYIGFGYPKEMRSYIEQLEKDLEYEAGSKAQQRDREYFHKLIGQSEPIYNGIDGPGALLEERKKNPNARAALFISKNVDSALDIFHLEEEPTARLLNFCEQQHISLQCLLIMGIRTYLQKMNGNDDVSINVAYARRATLAEKKSGGTRIHSFPFRTIISEDTTFLDGIHMIRGGQNEIFRHTNFDPVEYFTYRRQLYPVEPGRTYEPMSLTYQPMTMEDLGFTSFDFMSMLGEIEDEFDLEIVQEEAADIRTVQEAVDYLQKISE